MNAMLERLKTIVLELEKEHGPILVFALFLREDPLEMWDIVVSASWLNSKEMKSYQLIGAKIQERLSESDLLQVSRVVILDATDPTTIFLQNSYSITNGKIEEISASPLSNRFGFTIKQAYLLRCQTTPSH